MITGIPIYRCDRLGLATSDLGWCAKYQARPRPEDVPDGHLTKAGDGNGKLIDCDGCAGLVSAGEMKPDEENVMASGTCKTCGKYVSQLRLGLCGAHFSAKVAADRRQREKEAAAAAEAETLASAVDTRMEDAARRADEAAISAPSTTVSEPTGDISQDPRKEMHAPIRPTRRPTVLIKIDLDPVADAGLIAALGSGMHFMGWTRGKVAKAILADWAKARRT